jgi:hypothetical protein
VLEHPPATAPAPAAAGAVTVRFVPDVERYAGAVAELVRAPGAGAPVPVLRPPGSVFPAELEGATVRAGTADGAGGPCWQRAGRADPQAWYRSAAPADPAPSDSLVLAAGDPDWALAGMLHAALTGRPFRWCAHERELVEASAAAGSVAVCLPLDAVEPGLVRQLTEAGSFRVPRPGVDQVALAGRPLSVLTARTLEILTRVVARAAVRRHQPVTRSALVSTEPVPGRLRGGEVTQLDPDEATLPAVRGLADPDLLMLWGHSREDLFHLGGDALCGASREAAAADPAERLPACRLDGRCVKDGELLPVAGLGTRVLVIGGCNIMRLGRRAGTFAPEFALSLSAQEGAAEVVVAGPWTRSGSPVELAFLYRLLRAGVPLAEAVRRLSVSLPFTGSERPDYVVLGDGDRVLFPPAGDRADVRVADQATGADVDCRDLDTELVQFDLAEPAGELYVRAVDADGRPQAGTGLHSAVVPTPAGGCQVAVFGWSRIQRDRLRLRVDSRAPAVAASAALAAAIRSLHAYGRLLRGYLPKLKNQEQELRSLATFLARRVGEARSRTDAYAEAERKGAEAEQLLSRMDSALCRYLVDRVSVRAFVWHDQYLQVDGTFHVTGHRTSGECPYCGGVVMVRDVGWRFDPAVARELSICENCGTIADREAGGVLPVLTGPSTLVRGATTRFRVQLTSRSAVPEAGWMGIRLRQASRHGTEVAPALSELRLPPGGTAEAEFDVRVGEAMPAHMEILRGFWTSRLGITVFQRPVWVVPAD